MDNKEIKKLKEFVREYQEIEFNVNLMQKSIIGLGEKRARLLNQLNNLKSDEKEFIDELISKYGNDNITPGTLMNILNNQ